MEFIGREKELAQLRKVLDGINGGRILIYGRRRMGKTTLIRKTLEETEGIKILYTALPIDLEGNAKALGDAVLKAIGIQSLRAESIDELFSFLSTRNERITIAIDEYQDMKKRADSDYVDALFRTAIDNLPANISIILSGSSIRLMKALLDEENPLFQRFNLTMRIDEMDYIEAALFYPGRSIRDRIILYSVFGGIPLLTSSIDESISVEENIISMFVDDNGIARNYIRSVIDTEISPIPDAFIILSALGNGKRHYTEILSCLSEEKNRTQLARTLKSLINSGLIRKRAPINSEKRKDAFYEIASNPIRFYFSYMLRADDFVSISSKAFFSSFIEPSLTTYVSYRFEDMAKSYFSILTERGKRMDIMQIGNYWYDDRKKKSNGEFDVVLYTDDGYEIYECKFLKSRATSSLVKEEKRKAMAIEGIPMRRFGFISSSGFEEEKETDVILISGKDMYDI